MTTNIKATDTYLSILNSIIGQLSDGIWENTSACDKYWRSLDVTTSEDGYIQIIDRHSVCSNPIDYMANKIKQIIKIEIEDGITQLHWDRHCSANPSYLGYSNAITVGECYKLYEMLKGRDVSKKTYSEYRMYHVETSYKNYDVKALSMYSARELAGKRILAELMSDAKVSEISEI